MCMHACACSWPGLKAYALLVPLPRRPAGGSRKRKQPAGSNSEQAGSPAQAGTPSQNTLGEQPQVNQPWQQSNLRMTSNARGEFPFLDGSHDGSLGGAQPRDSLNNGLLDQLDNHMEELLGADCE